MKLIPASAAAALVIAPFVQPAHAQTGLTLYGVLEGGINRVTGLRSGSATRLDSGVMEGSKLGLRGTEEMGGGFKAIFNLDSRLEVDTGGVGNGAVSGLQLPDRMSTAAGLGLASLPLPVPATQALIDGVNDAIGRQLGANAGPDGGRLFDRQAYAGLITPWGAVTLGRQYTPAFIVGATFDASQTQSSLAAGQVGSFPQAFDIRLSNTVQYTLQSGGLTAALMAGAGEVPGERSAGGFRGGMLIYKGAGFAIGIGRNSRKNELGQRSLTNRIAGASFDVGGGTLYGQYITVRDDNPSGLSSIGALVGSATGSPALGAAFHDAYARAFMQDATLAHVGYRFTRGPHTWVVAYSRLDDRRAADADTASYGVTYTRALSPRTNVNAILTRFANSGQGQTAPGGSGFLGGVTASAGVDATNVALTLRHTF